MDRLVLILIRFWLVDFFVQYWIDSCAKYKWKKNNLKCVNRGFFLLARPSQDIFLPPLIQWIEQGRSIILVALLYDLCDDVTIISFIGGVSTDQLLCAPNERWL